MTQAKGTHPFSSDKPVFELEKHVVREHDETCINVVEHELSYKAGPADSIYSLSLGMVGFSISSPLTEIADSDTTIRFMASIHFPSIRRAQLEGSFTTDVEPVYEELEIIASGLMAILANKKVEAQITAL